MHGWFCQIELIESIWQQKAELRENLNALLIKSKTTNHFPIPIDDQTESSYGAF